MEEPVWIDEKLALAIHERQLTEHGGTSGIRDQGVLESALARAREKWAYGTDLDMPALAAAYAFGLVRNRPFVDGNKRTAYVVCRTFFLLDGWDLLGSLAERYPVMIALAAGELDEEGFAAWLREHARLEDVSESRGSYA